MIGIVFIALVVFFIIWVLLPRTLLRFFEFDEIEIRPEHGQQLAPSVDRFVNFNALQTIGDSSAPAVAIGVLYVPWRL